MYIIKKNGEQVDRARSITDALVVRDTLREFYPMSVIEMEESK